MKAPSRRDVLRLAAASGLVATAAGSVLAAEKKPDRERKSDRWRAWAVTQGDRTRLVVEGIYGEGGPGVVVLVKEAALEGNPKVLLLDLKTAALPGVWPMILQPVPAHYIRSPYDEDRYESVQVRYPDGNVVSIDRIIDTGNGPK
jgi:hypothetical protein